MTLRVPPGAECGRNTPDFIAASDVSEPALIDLRGLSWVEPIGLVTIAAYAERQVTRGRDVKVLTPENESRARYVSRMGLGDVLSKMGSAVRHNLPSVNRNPLKGRLVELQRFDGTSGATALAEIVFDTVERFDAIAASAVYRAIAELGTNVPEHAGVESGFVASQVVDHGTELRFAVGDCGSGLRTPMQTAGAEDDLSALRLALTKSVTTTGAVTRGKGLAAVAAITRSAGGYLHLASGSAGLTVWDGAEQARSHRLRFRGTLLQGMIRCKPVDI